MREQDLRRELSCPMSRAFNLFQEILLGVSRANRRRLAWNPTGHESFDVLVGKDNFASGLANADLFVETHPAYHHQR